MSEQTEEQRQQAAAERARQHREKFAANADDGREAPVDDGQPAADGPVKPEHVPEKFWNAETGEVNYEAWNKAHSELEKQFHQGNQDPAATGDNNEPPAGDEPEGDGDSDDDKSKEKQVLETPAAQTAAENYAKNGKLDESDYAALEAQGISRDMVDTYIEGQKAKASTVVNAAYEPAGGEENYRAMIEWAAENLEDGDIAAFNAQVQTDDPAVIRSAVTGLYKQYAEKATVEGNRTGGGAPANNSAVFNSRKEMADAINKLGDDGRRRYDTDPAYRTEIARKIGNTRRAGIAL